MFHGTWNDTKCDLAKPYICKISSGMPHQLAGLGSPPPIKNKTTKSIVYDIFQRVHRQHLCQVTGCVCRSGTPTAVTVTTCTTASKASLGQSRAITVSRSGEIWHLSTAGQRWSSSETSTTPNITTFGSASPGTVTVSIAGSILMSPTPVLHVH